MLSASTASDMHNGFRQNLALAAWLNRLRVMLSLGFSEAWINLC
jgi:hypothetical protein